MKSVIKPPLSAGIAICALLSAVSCGSTDRGSGLNHMYDAALCGNPGSLDPQYASDEAAAEVIRNLYRGLTERDSSGSIVYAGAESCNISGDGTVYTFTLREDNYWFFDENNDDIIGEDECFPVTADDYVFALQRVLDPAMQSPYAEEFSGIKGAKDPETGAISAENAQLYAVDSKTLVVVLEEPDAEFLARMASPAAYPCNREFFLSTKGRYGLDDRSVMSNGAFYVRQWFYDPYGVNNILYMKRNEKNRTEEYEICPAYLSYSIEEDSAAVMKRLKDKETECLSTYDRTPYSVRKYTISAEAPVTLGLIFNHENTLWSSPSMRNALARSIDRAAVDRELSEDGNTDISTASGLIPPAVTLLGRSYRELSSDRQFDMYDPDSAAKSVSDTKSASGISSFEAVRILVSSEAQCSSYLHRLSQRWQDVFGVYIGIDEVTPEEFEERIESGEYSIALYPLICGAGSTGTGEAYFRQLETEPCLKYCTGGLTLTPELRKCSSAEELVEKYTAAEKIVLETQEFIPLFYKNRYLIMDNDNEGIGFDPFTGAADYRLALNFS
ncbi:MAG: peptide ABC transporter substrate-binding protein [Ruminococcus sp.]|nr:peptide ABC transporter substrate-binding protein [Ruminococcus sp.]